MTITLSDSYRAMEKTNFYDAIYSPVVLILNAVVVAAVMLLSASGNARVLTLFGMSAGTAVAVINYISQIFTPVESLGMEIQTIQSAVAGVRRINEFLSQSEPAPASPSLCLPICPLDSRRWNCATSPLAMTTTRCCKTSDLQVQAGEQVTLAGRTGAGKSTVFKLLLGLYTPQSGSVLIEGVPAADIADQDRRSAVRLCGAVASIRCPALCSDQITLYDRRHFGSGHAHGGQAGRAFGYHRKPAAGLRYPLHTRSCFRRDNGSCCPSPAPQPHDPRMLLLDEITANLDAETENTVLQALRRVSADRTVISISHRTGAQTGRVIPIEPAH